MSVDSYEVALAVVGLIGLFAAWLPSVIRKWPLSLPVALVGLGAAVFVLPLGLPELDPTRSLELTERVTELGVLVALTGAGLKIDRAPGWRAWGSTWRVLLLAMPLTIAATAVLGWWVLGLGPAAAVLLGSVLAPTDPVLASDVQVGEPTVEGDAPNEEDEVRFGLTSEAGLNDALAFPFVYLAIRMADRGTAPQHWLAQWLAFDVAYRLPIGALVGYLVGRFVAMALFRRLGSTAALADASQGSVVVAFTLMAYGVAELAQAYGFLAVFVAAVTIRSSERRHVYHKVLHEFSEQAENLLVVGLLVVFGGALATGLLASLTWRTVVVALAVLLVVRPVTGWVSLWGRGLDWSERWALAFFGVRGVGSFYYLAYALSAENFRQTGTLWTVVSLTVLASIAVHGITATPAMRRVDRRRRLLRRRAVLGRRRAGAHRDGVTAGDER